MAGEFTLVALTHKILKLWRASLAPAGSAKEASRTRFLTAAAPPTGPTRPKWITAFPKDLPAPVAAFLN